MNNFFSSTILLIFFSLLAISFDAFAQFNALENRVLENTSFQFASEGFIEDTSTYTRGGSSLKNRTNQPLPNLSLLFLEGNNTVFFDWKFQSSISFEFFEMFLYDLEDFSDSNIVLSRRFPKSDVWCRDSIFIPASVNVSQITFLIDVFASAGTVANIDNIRVFKGNQTRARDCDLDKNTGFISPVISLLLDDENPSTPDPVEPYVFKGKVELPDDLVAGVGGVTVEVGTFPLVTKPQDLGGIILNVPVRATVIIPEGQNSASYSLEFPESLTFEDVSIEFECLEGCQELSVTNVGFWDKAKGVTGDSIFISQFNIPAGAVEDILLEDANYYTGTVDLPDGIITSDFTFIPVTVADQTPLSFESFSVFLAPDAGLNSIPFAIGVPVDLRSDGWNVDADCFTCPSTLSPEAQYATTSVGDPTSANPLDAFLFSDNTDYLDMTLSIPEVVAP